VIIQKYPNNTNLDAEPENGPLERKIIFQEETPLLMKKHYTNITNSPASE